MGFPVKLSVEMRSNRRETLDTTGLVHTDSGKEYSCAENMRRRDTVRNYVLFSDNRRLVMKNGKLKLNRKVCARTEELYWFVDCFCDMTASLYYGSLHTYGFLGSFSLFLPLYSVRNSLARILIAIK